MAKCVLALKTIAQSLNLMSRDFNKGKILYAQF